MRATARTAALAAVLLTLAGCNAANDPQVRVVDLLTSGVAERRPAKAELHIEERTFGTDTRSSLAVPPDSRIIWQMAVPARGTLNTSVGLSGGENDAATFRIAISDQRIYEPLVERTVTGGESARGWVPLNADLSRYAGWQWSLFYRPDGRQWRIILAVTRVGGTPDKAFWALPGIDADTASATQFVSRRGR